MGSFKTDVSLEIVRVELQQVFRVLNSGDGISKLSYDHLKIIILCLRCYKC
jgi:hypothetical protein